MRRSRLHLVAALLAGHPAAGQEALYGAQPPQGSAYVRFANATGWSLELRPDFLPRRTLGRGEADRVSPYGVVERPGSRPLTLEVEAGGHTARASLSVAAGSFDTVLLRESASGALTATVVVDKAPFNQERARLAFYNATPDCPAATLALAPTGAAIFDGVGAGSERSREVNPATARLWVGCARQSAPELSVDTMEIGASYSIWLMTPHEQPVAFMTRDATSPYRP